MPFRLSANVIGWRPLVMDIIAGKPPCTDADRLHLAMLVAARRNYPACRLAPPHRDDLFA
jgi:hypothetical protein